MLTINEYKNQHHISNKQLSELLNVSEETVTRWSNGEEASAASVKKLKAIGIDHPMTRHHRKSAKKEVKVEKPKFDSKILKEHQVVIIRGFGNTIVSKKHKAEDIINEFARFGLSVELTDFQDKTHYDWNTHYVVTNVGVAKC